MYTVQRAVGSTAWVDASPSMATKRDAIRHCRTMALHNPSAYRVVRNDKTREVIYIAKWSSGQLLTI